MTLLSLSLLCIIFSFSFSYSLSSSWFSHVYSLFSFFRKLIMQSNELCPSYPKYHVSGCYYIHKFQILYFRRCQSSVSNSLTEVPSDTVKLKCVTLDPEKELFSMNKYEECSYVYEKITIKKSNIISLLWWCNQQASSCNNVFDI